MTLDLSDSFTGTVVGGFLLMVVGGFVHYIITLNRFYQVKKDLKNVLAEVKDIHTVYKNDIANLKEVHNAELTQAVVNTIGVYDKKIDHILEHYSPMTPLEKANRPKTGGWASLIHSSHEK